MVTQSPMAAKRPFKPIMSYPCTAQTNFCDRNGGIQLVGVQSATDGLSSPGGNAAQGVGGQAGLDSGVDRKPMIRLPRRAFTPEG